MSAVMMTVRDVCERLNLSKIDTVLKLIHSGKLKAHNVSAGSGRATYRISETALAEFLQQQATSAPPARRPRRKRAAQTPTQFF